MGIDFYYHPGSPPCRAVLLAAETFEIQLNLIRVDPLKQEQLKPEYLKINPRHTIPAIVDNGFILCESRAILQYFANAYSKDDTMYPKSAKERALVDQMLYFDMGALNKCLMETYVPLLFGGKLDPEKIKTVDTNLAYLEEFLKNSKFVAGDKLTIADFSVITSITSFEGFGHKFNKYPLTVAYIETCKTEMKGYNELNQKAIASIRELLKILESGNQPADLLQLKK